jgi:hypothetical protein
LVQQFDIETHLTKQLPTELPSRILLRAAGVSCNGTIFIFNGIESIIMEFSEQFGTAQIICALPFLSSYYYGPISTTAIHNGHDGVWLFAGYSSEATNPILFFNTTDKVVFIPSLKNATSTLPNLFDVPASMSDGRQGYLIGGLGRLSEHDGSYHPTNGIIT